MQKSRVYHALLRSNYIHNKQSTLFEKFPETRPFFMNTELYQWNDFSTNYFEYRLWSQIIVLLSTLSGMKLCTGTYCAVRCVHALSLPDPLETDLVTALSVFGGRSGSRFNQKNVYLLPVTTTVSSEACILRRYYSYDLHSAEKSEYDFPRSLSGINFPTISIQLVV